MPFQIIRKDISLMKVDAIVNSANTDVAIGTGVDLAIHKTSGEALFEARKKIGKINVGESKLTKGFNLKAKHVIHTVGPLWIDGTKGEYEDLRSCYLSSLNLALSNNLISIAFPLISSGTFGYPKDKALKIATETIKSFLFEHEMMVYLVVYDDVSYELSKNLTEQVDNYILDHYIDDSSFMAYEMDNNFVHDMLVDSFDIRTNKSRSIVDVIDEIDETFVESLFRLTDQKGMTDIELYKKANIDRRLFSKIKSNFDYQPSKITAISFSIALELNLDETKDLLSRAGYALSPSHKFDLIIQFFIENENYDVYEINQVLFKFDQKTLG
ncbi:macro domain-containing protein [Mariniplasma anaerobium]|uniref:Uncharacterized protein n=1 Tax=Mariniplasma anaerobium TaxID=2735436 RepID=A0A7U9THN8_9MOLU|nr:macro domain-containing protein [Mariniplasma anaerobium]BCR36678.1 hypothetical protein MPAN_015710 [Mariniplasma anaerobium]